VRKISCWIFWETFFLILIFLTQSFFVVAGVHADIQGTTYQLKNYGFGNGGTNGVTGSTYGINGLAGEQTGSQSGTTYKLTSGLIVTEVASAPASPIFTNPGTNYDRLKFVLIQGDFSSDTTFALEISTDNFVTDIRYVKSDGTVGNSLATADYKTYANWGSASGTWITGLINNTTYYLRAKARHGQYTDSAWGPASNVATSVASLVFNLSSSSITFNNLTAANSYTDSSQSTTFTTSTNAYDGYVIYAKENQPLTSADSTIANYSSPNSSPTIWSGTGFGYTTNDTTLYGSGGGNRFNNGTLYAGFQTSGPGDPVASNLGPITSTPITNEHYTVSYRVTANSLTPAETYSNVIVYTIVPQY